MRSLLVDVQHLVHFGIEKVRFVLINRIFINEFNLTLLMSFLSALSLVHFISWFVSWNLGRKRKVCAKQPIEIKVRLKNVDKERASVAETGEARWELAANPGMLKDLMKAQS